MSEKNNKFINTFLKYLSCYVAVLVVVFLIVHYSAGTGEREKLWTDLMLFVNFGVLVFLFLRFARKPLINFLKGEGDRISEQLKKIEADVKEARSSMEVEAAKLKNIDSNLASITQGVIAAGTREKENIIERAQTIADKMINDAKKEAEYKMLAAKKRFSEEMLDAAIKITAERIKQNITREDDEKLINAFSTSLDSGHNLAL